MTIEIGRNLSNLIIVFFIYALAAFFIHKILK